MTLLVFVIHGGGWQGGSKERINRFVDVKYVLEAGISTAVLRCNTANSSSTIGVKKENMNKRIALCRFESEVLRKPALHIATPLSIRA